MTWVRVNLNSKEDSKLRRLKKALKEPSKEKIIKRIIREYKR